MATAWRIIKTKYAHTAFTGEGARQYGSRWTGRGRAIAFASSSLSLATLEILVHIRRYEPLEAYSVLTVEFDPRLVKSLDASSLPENWRDHPAPPELRKLGNDWQREGTSLLLTVPSVVIESEHNYLINPAHPDFGKLVISSPTPLAIDTRLFDGD